MTVYRVEFTLFLPSIPLLLPVASFVSVENSSSSVLISEREAPATVSLANFNGIWISHVPYAYYQRLHDQCLWDDRQSRREQDVVEKTFRYDRFQGRVSLSFRIDGASRRVFDLIPLQTTKRSGFDNYAGAAFLGVVL